MVPNPTPDCNAALSPRSVRNKRLRITRRTAYVTSSDRVAGRRLLQVIPEVALPLFQPAALRRVREHRVVSPAAAALTPDQRGYMGAAALVETYGVRGVRAYLADYDAHQAAQQGWAA